MKNNVEIKFKAIPENEAFARNVVSSFILQLNPTIDELEDIKTAVSEAVTNVIVHAYPNSTGYVTMKLSTSGKILNIKINDNGVGITNIEQALTPFYTSKPEEERSGMGFLVMKSFMDSLVVKNISSGGLSVVMEKQINKVAE